MNNLHWIHEPATRQMDEEGRIYEEVIGKPADYLVAIYEGAERTEAGFRNVPMICIKHVGERDFVSHVVTEQHRARFPRAFKWWDAQKDRIPKVDVRLLPGISPAEVAELEELKLDDVAALCDGVVPDHLSGLKAMALRFRSLSKPRLRMENGELRAMA